MMNYLYSISLVLFLMSSCTDINFNSSEWKKWDIKSDTNLRWDMVDDLINNYNLEGKTKLEIIELLGEPESNVQNPSDDYYYDLGPCRRGIDFGSLNFKFKNNKVIKIEKTCN